MYRVDYFPDRWYGIPSLCGVDSLDTLIETFSVKVLVVARERLWSPLMHWFLSDGQETSFCKRICDVAKMRSSESSKPPIRCRIGKHSKQYGATARITSQSHVEANFRIYHYSGNIRPRGNFFKIRRERNDFFINSNRIKDVEGASFFLANYRHQTSSSFEKKTNFQ